MDKVRISFIIGLIFLYLVLFISSGCNEYIRQDELKPLSQKKQILKMIDSKIKYSNDETKIRILKDLRDDIIFRVEEEVNTNG